MSLLPLKALPKPDPEFRAISSAMTAEEQSWLRVGMVVLFAIPDLVVLRPFRFEGPSVSVDVWRTV
jgi:hypothetical protein